MACDGGMPPVLQVRDLAVHAAAGTVVRLPRLELPAGGAVALVGPSGCGKSTLLAALLGVLQRPGWRVAGEIHFGGEGAATGDGAARRAWLRRAAAFLPQDPHAAFDPLPTIGRQLHDATGETAAECARMLGWLGVAAAPAVAARRPHQISGGQAQRALLAIAFLRRPQVCIVDEPTAHLAEATATELVGHLRVLRRNGAALLLATHDRRFARALDAEVLAGVDGVFTPAAAAEAPWPVRSDRDVGPAAPVLAARGLAVAHGRDVVLRDCDLAVGRGEVVAVLGPSGSGKSTLLHAFAGRLPLAAGAVDRPARATAVQLVPQDAHGSLTPGVAIGRLVDEVAAEGFVRAQAAAALGLAAATLGRSREALSGGEHRRAALLRALAVQPDVLLLDEPTASLDRATAIAVVGALLELRRDRGLAIVLATHDEALAAAVADRACVLRGGQTCPIALPSPPR
jgi:ABC-type glutathione transport system ATPase component